MEKRVCFDFEVEFSNGGGIQGQGFRLDIDSDDIDDDALAAYLIADMRLLMVGQLRILNKRIIEEPHKRMTAPADAGARAIINLSHAGGNSALRWHDLPTPRIADPLPRRGRSDSIATHGTGSATPGHHIAHGQDLDGRELRGVAAVPGVVVRVVGARQRALDWHHFVPFDCRGRAVLVHTGWDRHWGTPHYAAGGHPFMTEKAAIYLRDHGALIVGIDSPSLDDTTAQSPPVHAVLSAAGIPIIEHLTGLDALPAAGFQLHAAAPAGGSVAVPVRAHAVVD